MNKFKKKYFRRLAQFAVLFLLFSSFYDLNIFEGNLIASELFGIPLTDPVATVDFFLSGFHFNETAFLGFIVVLFLYFILGGRTFCSWVCPYHILAEVSKALNEKFGLKKTKYSYKTKYWILGIIFLSSLVLSVPVFEAISPIGIISSKISNLAHLKETEITTGLILQILLSTSVLFVLFLFLIEVFFLKNFWCNNVCPVGAVYSIIGKYSLLKVKIDKEKCVQCEDCYEVCMVPDVLDGVVFGEDKRIKDSNCTNCLNCIDRCEYKALSLKLNFKGE